jgi:hypothetical protein
VHLFLNTTLKQKAGDGGGEQHNPQQQHTAEYLTRPCVELAQFAKRQRFDPLAYLLDMAVLEVRQVMCIAGRRRRTPPDA